MRHSHLTYIGTVASIALWLGTAAPGVAALPMSAVPGPAPHRHDRASAPAVQVTAVEAVGMTVADMDRAVQFYTTVLPFIVESDQEVSGRAWEQLQGVFNARLRVVVLRLGDERLELTQYLAPRGRPMPVDSRGNDRWFQHVAIIVSDMAAAYDRLRTHAVPHASSGPQRLPDWNPGAAGIEAFYFRDPDGHFLEILRFPAGKGDPRWQARRASGPADPGGVFLGIDHTAIVVGDTADALGFYRDGLGLTVSGTGVNHGVEQEHLNGVFGVRLRITTLRAASGPAVELLEYMAPRDGRPTPIDIKANDIAHWQITMRAAGLTGLLEPTSTWQLVSPDVTTIDPPAPLTFTHGVLVRDGDGHGVRVVR